MLTQTAERQELHKVIDMLSDKRAEDMLKIAKILQWHFEDDDWVDPIETGTWNAETLEAIREVEEGRAERFESKEALFKDLGL